MRRLLLVLLALCVVGQGMAIERVLSALHDPASEYVVVVSHRGDWRNYPENSLPAIESVIRMGVDIVEIDIKMTKDSVLVVCHDPTLDRTTTGSGNISDYTYEELLQFDLKRGHGIAKKVLEAGSKIWVNTIWGSLCGEHDDDKAFDSPNPDEIYGPILSLGTSIIQTDRPEFLIQYLKGLGKH